MNASDQAAAWSRAASFYDQEFVDPYRPDADNPVLRALRRLPDAECLTAADFGCGRGPLLPLLASRFARVWGVDFAPAMIEAARTASATLTNVQFLERAFADLRPLHGQIDVATSINSLVLPDIAELDTALVEMRRCLRPGGRLYGVVPSIDSVHYHTMLLVDRALASGKPLEVARRNAAHFVDHDCYEFAFGRFTFQGIEQHFWQPFEIPYRLRRAGFRSVQIRRVRLAWAQFALGPDLSQHPRPWDWCFLARV
ncbi:MAG TPA: methyltransferase domain-containing protein [Gemmatales bacterium]|nr:methyltransferase domain-containing protein [Gemmatales bacterium]